MKKVIAGGALVAVIAALSGALAHAQIPATKIEAESMTRSDSTLVRDYAYSSASGGQQVAITGPAYVSDTREYANPITRVGVNVGAYLQGRGATVRYQVLVDDVVRIDKTIPNQTILALQEQAVNVPAGTHTVKVVYVSAQGATYSELWVDYAQVTAGSSSPDPEGTNTTPTVAVGVEPGGAWWDQTNLNDYSTVVGQKPKIVLAYQSWGPASDAPFCTGCAQNLHNQGYQQILTWEPKDYTKGTNQPAYSMDKINGGAYDRYITDYAKAIKASGVPIYLRLAHEMNGNWYPWSPGVGSNTPAKYVKMWKHVRAIFDREGVTNVKWVFSPNVGKPVYAPKYPMSRFYPGDSYVDLVSLDGYNFAGCNGSPWYSFEQVFGGSYDELKALAPSKPIFVNEVSSDERGGDKAQWIRNMNSAISTRFPDLKAVVWYHLDYSGCRLKVDSSQASLDAYKAYLADPYYAASGLP